MNRGRICGPLLFGCRYWLSEVRGDGDLAGRKIEGEVNTLAGFESEQFDVLVDDVHPRHARAVGRWPFGQAGERHVQRAAVFAFLGTCFKIGVSHNQLLE